MVTEPLQTLTRAIPGYFIMSISRAGNLDVTPIQLTYMNFNLYNIKKLSQTKRLQRVLVKIYTDQGCQKFLKLSIICQYIEIVCLTSYFPMLLK